MGTKEVKAEACVLLFLHLSLTRSFLSVEMTDFYTLPLIHAAAASHQIPEHQRKRSLSISAVHLHMGVWQHFRTDYTSDLL